MHDGRFEPQLHSVAISELRPTQITVGFKEVARKRHEWGVREIKERPDFLGRHMIPVVVGPKGRYWIVDHHHLVLALHEEGVEHVFTSVLANLSQLKPSTFLTFMDNRNWLHPFDEKGHRQGYEALPQHIGKLVDDPYRSLAGAVRRAGGYAKVDTPYSEFLWADFLRGRIKRSKLEARFDHSVVKAVAIANSEDAKYLPGWAGVSAS
ncbi:MAG: chromosome partitioning protein ParB [Sphingobium sp.]|nr:chromosome partitioning protein ParB [Sphingobium sp.]